jgi:hypothetical protein
VSEDWNPVGTRDDLLGDPEVIGTEADRFAVVGEVLGDQGGRLADVQPDGIWVGFAAQTFADARDELPVTLRAVQLRCEAASETLRTWSSEVSDHQERGRDARDRAREADVDIAAAITGCRIRDGFLADARRDAARRQQLDPDGGPVAPDPWTGPEWPARLEEARQRRADAQRDFDEVVRSYTEAAGRTAEQLADATDDDLADGSAFSRLRGWFASRRAVQGPFEFLVTPDGLVLNTRESWMWEAYRQAGIDPTTWDPRRGLTDLDDTVVAAWEYYAVLYKLDPDRLQWAGLANLAGGTLYGGFQDIHVVRRAFERGELSAEQLREALRSAFPGLPRSFYDDLISTAGSVPGGIASELAFVERTFLKMQRDIFDDMAWQHLAFATGGLPAVEALHGSGQLSDELARAWRFIGSDDPARVAQGNLLLANHEQRTIIEDDYDAIRDRSPITWGLTVAMSLAAPSPVPGGTSFRDSVPYEVNVSWQSPEVHIRIPERVDLDPPGPIPNIGFGLPGGGTELRGRIEIDETLAELPINNVSIDEKRWQWVTRDIIPDYQGLLDSGRADEVIGVPIPEQGAAQRLVPDRLLPYEGN